MARFALCGVDGCRQPAHCRGWCSKHYQRWLRHGDPTMVLIGNAEHGTYNMYANHKCRCDPCRKAASAYVLAANHRTGRCRPREQYLAELAAQPKVHGTEGGYNRGCRCASCKDASVEARKRRRHADIERTRAYDRAYKRRSRAA